MSGFVKSWLSIFNSYHYFKKSRCQVLSKDGWVYSIPTTISRRADVRYCQKLAGYFQLLPLFQEEQMSGIVKSWLGIFNSYHYFKKSKMSGIVKSWLGIFSSYHYFKKSRCQILSKTGWILSIPTTISRRVDVRFCQKLAGYIQFLPLFQEEQMSDIVKRWLGIFNTYHHFKKSRCQVLSKAGWVYSIPTFISRRADVRYCQKLVWYIQFLPLFQEEQNVRYCQKLAWYIRFLPLFQQEPMLGTVKSLLGIFNSYHYFKKSKMSGIVKSWLGLFSSYHYFKKSRCQILSKTGWV